MSILLTPLSFPIFLKHPHFFKELLIFLSYKCVCKIYLTYSKIEYSTKVLNEMFDDKKKRMLFSFIIEFKINDLFIYLFWMCVIFYVKLKYITYHDNRRRQEPQTQYFTNLMNFVGFRKFWKLRICNLQRHFIYITVDYTTFITDLYNIHKTMTWFII